MNFNPLNDRVLVQPDKEEDRTSSGIILVHNKEEKPVSGTVVVGGKLVKKGRRILFSKFGFDEVTIDKEIYYVVSESNILGIYD